VGQFLPFRGKLASWNLEFCNSCVVLLRNVQVPRRNSDSHLVFRDPTQLKKNGNAHLTLLYNQTVSIARNTAEHPK
jgi:hypothetical protein